MTTTITITIRCDHQDADGFCGSAYRYPGTIAEARRTALAYGWQLGQLGQLDLCPRCVSRTAKATDPQEGSYA